MDQLVPRPDVCLRPCKHHFHLRTTQGCVREWAKRWCTPWFWYVRLPLWSAPPPPLLLGGSILTNKLCPVPE